MCRIKSIFLELLGYFNNFILGYLTLLNIIYTLLLLLSCWGLYFHLKKRGYEGYYKLLTSPFLPSISILVPCFNEQKTIVENVESLLSLEYSKSEIIVINDGSSDNSLSQLIEAFVLKKVERVYKRDIVTQDIRGIYLSSTVPDLIVIDKENGGKADALNAGINMAKSELVTAIDADSILKNDSLLKIARPFIEDGAKVVASGGMVRIANGAEVDKGFVEQAKLPTNKLAIFQIIEYLRAFLTGRVGFSVINGLLIVSGAFGLFRKEVLIDIGGYVADTIGEDMELIIKLHQFMKDKKRDYRVVFVADAICWTQGPDTLKSLFSQRKRWQRGLMDSLLTHWKMLFNPKYGKIGLVIVPYYWIFEMLGPFIELLGYISIIVSFLLGLLNLRFAILFFILTTLYGILISIAAILLEFFVSGEYKRVSDYLKLFLYIIFESFGYRQLITFWRVISVIGYKFRKNSWGAIERKTFYEG